MADLRRSLVINFFSSSGATILQFIVSLVLARMLSPSEIGVYSMTIVFVNLAHVFRDFGVTNYIQREKELTPDKIRSATGVVFTTSWLIATTMFLASEWLGRWFKEPGIVPVMHVLAIGFFIIPFGSITQSLLVREFAAEKQAYVNAIGTISYCVTCLVLANQGFGSLSLAYANLANIIVCSLAYLPLRPKGLPLMPSFKHWRNVAHFGLGSLLSTLLSTINNAVPDILLGKIGSARLVGLLSRSNSTALIFTYVAGSTVSYGAVSYLAQSFHRGESLAPALSRASVLLTGVGWTALALTAVLARDIVGTLYGPDWLECVPAIPPLAMSAAVGMLFHYVPMGVTAIGRPYLSTTPVLITLLSRISFGVLLFDGSLARFAWALCLATIAAAPVTVLQQQRHLGLPISVLLRAVAPSAVVAIGTAIPAYLLAALLPTALAPILRLLIMAPLLATVWYFLLRAMNHELVGEIHRLAMPVRARLLRLRSNI